MMKLYLIFFSLVFSLPVFSESSYILKLGSKVEWSPYHLDTQDGSDGLAVRALACVMARINQPYLIRKLPWKRAQLETKIGILDGFFSASKNEERDSYATLTKVFLPQTRTFYALRRNINIQLKNYTLEYIRNNINVGARAGSNTLASLEEGNYRVVARPQSEEQLFHQLDAGRIGAMLENSLVFENLVEKRKRSINEYYTVIQTEKNMGLYLGHRFLANNPNFIESFNRNVTPCSLL